jgi:proline iminopeptidase
MKWLRRCSTDSLRSTPQTLVSSLFLSGKGILVGDRMKSCFTSARLKTGLHTLLIGSFFLMWGTCLLSRPPLQAQTSTQLKVETGYITSSDGVRLYYAKVGSGSKTVIMPGRLFAFRDFQRLAKGRTLIFYDMRNRGRSDALVDVSRISLQHDADDLEAVREHFGIEKPDLIGFSYLGKIVVLYAIQHPDHVNRIVQIGPVARKLGTKFPESLTAGDENKVPDPAETRKIEELYNNGFAKNHPKEYCEMEWKIEQQRMVGNPANTSRIPSPCEMENEWPIHLRAHFQPLLASDQALDIPKESIAKVTAPVLTIHGRKDRNAPYGGGREWDMLLPNARLITIDGAAHMSWVEFPETVFPSIDLFLNGQWPEQAEPVKHLELPPSKTGVQP